MQLPRRALVTWAIAVVCLAVAAHAQNPSQPLAMRIVDFSWPLANGAVVPSGATAVTLDRGMGFTMRFQLPQQCDALREAGERFGVDGSSGFRAQYDEAREFCGRARVFTLGSPTAPRDFVSRANFTTLALDLVPFEARCSGTVSPGMRDLCGRVAARDNTACASGTLPAHLSFALGLVAAAGSADEPRLDCRPLRVDAITCRMTHSQFIGTAAVRAGLVRCTSQATPGAAGIALRDVTFRDVNRDGTMDALLSVSDVNTPAQAAWFTFAVTKRTATGPIERIAIE